MLIKSVLPGVFFNFEMSVLYQFESKNPLDIKYANR